MFHTFCKDDNISFSKAQASASLFYTPAHSLYQEVEIILSSSFLSSGAVLFLIFCKDDNISFSQAQASASHFYTPAHSMYQEVILNGSFMSAVPELFHTFCIVDISLSQAQASASQFYTPAHSLYQEVKIILSDSILSAVPVLFHTFCKDNNISFSQAQASAKSVLYTST